jgi:hypothetical protein
MTHFFRTSITSLKASVPMLTNYTALKRQFDWLIDGEVTPAVSENLRPELKNMELFLR